MTKIDIISGFLGAGKTTLIKKLIAEVFRGQQIVLIENEFGEIGIDGGFLKDAGINITEMNSGCICCSLVGDFGQALRKVEEQFHPDRILIEPSGVGKLSDVRRAVENVAKDVDMKVNSLTTVVDAKKVNMYMKNFGEFYNNQVESAGTIVLSRTQGISGDKLNEVVAMLKEKNPKAAFITTAWDQISGQQILAAMEKSVDLAAELMASVDEDEDEECCCHHHHDHDEEEHDHEHHEHHHEHCKEEHAHHHEHDGEEHAHHEHDEEEHEHHHHHHHHDADDVFTSWGTETARKYTKEELEGILTALDDGSFGAILRAKGMLPSADGGWIYFDMVPGEHELRDGQPEVTGKFCVIGSELKEDRLAELFKA